MYSVLLVIHVIITLALIGIVLIQRADSDGLSGLGGGGGNMSSFLTGRSQANFLTRTTAVLAGAFILTSLTLGILIAQGKGTGTLAERLARGEQTAPTTVPAAETAPTTAPQPQKTAPASVPRPQ